jgi:hypothetical protein
MGRRRRRARMRARIGLGYLANPITFQFAMLN